ncbi:hypothetical protein U9M48_029045 [Paspalum notatum var. saurae]|uniref:Uncharacterized protein n=1 Tax=Paspalum notatum var. saurae TaxID=547442 RepID=A0AAQ3TY21_PASNO
MKEIICGPTRRGKPRSEKEPNTLVPEPWTLDQPSSSLSSPRDDSPSRRLDGRRRRRPKPISARSQRTTPEIADPRQPQATPRFSRAPSRASPQPIRAVAVAISSRCRRQAAERTTPPSASPESCHPQGFVLNFVP